MWTAEKIYYQDSSGYTRAYQGSELVWERVYNEAIRFTAKQANSTVGLAAKSTGQTLEYSTDLGNTWTNMTTATTITLVNSGDSVYIRGTLSSDNSASNYTRFKMSGNIKLSGNIAYAWNYQNPSAALKNRCGVRFFEDCTALTDASELVFPSTATNVYSYGNFFHNCTNLTKIPKILPATSLGTNCYQNMFHTCTSLVDASGLQLPATTLNANCYSNMFYGCSSLLYTPELPATTLASACYQGMFYQCTSLTTPPELPATTLVSACYQQMFQGCTSLVDLSNYSLPSTTLAESCYRGMFQDCTSLTTAPTLSAATLKNYCYRYMFSGCTHLNYIKCLATNISATQCTYNWVNGVASSGTFVKAFNMTGWTVDSINGIPIGWTVKEEDVAGVKFTAKQANSTVGLSTKSAAYTLQYTTDGTNWNTMTTGTTITLTNSGESVCVRGILSNNQYSTQTIFSMSGNIKASGNINYLWNYNDLSVQLKEYCGAGLFSNCRALTDASGLQLPSTSLAANCYEQMFFSCGNLIKGPNVLPATTLKNSCYYSMFEGCTSLTEAPTIYATTLSDKCCEAMFARCTSLVKGPTILPATTPRLPSDCYYRMFEGCTSLTTAPELPATQIGFRSYRYMFNGCTSLNYIKCLITSAGSYATQYWVRGVAASGTFVKNSSMTDWTTGNDGIPQGWTVQND